jgi:hypothetical protein
MRKAAPFIFSLLVFGVAGLVSIRAQESARAQQPASAATESAATESATEQNRATPSAPDVDLSITANVTARELRFDAVPNPKVEFTGKPARVTAWEAERQNLPRPVEPGVTYRNIGIQLKITSVFADIDRIVAEALGEVPQSDDARPTPQQPAPQQTAPQQQQDAAPPSSPLAQPESEGSPR